MDTLPLPTIVGLEVIKQSQSEILSKDNHKFYRQKTKFRVIPTENVSFTQYTNTLLLVRSFLLDHIGIPFIWEYTGKSYYWVDAQIEYLEDGTKGNVTLSLVLNQNQNL